MARALTNCRAFERSGGGGREIALYPQIDAGSLVRPVSRALCGKIGALRVTSEQRALRKYFVNDNAGLHPAGNFVEAFGLQCRRAPAACGGPLAGW